MSVEVRVLVGIPGDIVPVMVGVKVEVEVLVNVIVGVRVTVPV